MILYFGSPEQGLLAVQCTQRPPATDFDKLQWLFGGKPVIDAMGVKGKFIGPRAAMITPWSTNAVEITQTMGIKGIVRIEEFKQAGGYWDPMVSQQYDGLDQDIFTIVHEPENIRDIEDIARYNTEEGLALSVEEIKYLNELSERLGRRLTDSEVFGFSQVNSEHCRHKIFNGSFVIDGEEKTASLFELIKKTTKKHPNEVVSAYSDNVAFIKGPRAVQFAPDQADRPGLYTKKAFQSIISLKAETHNFPTTVEPFNGAATGSGGEIRDRLAGGRGAVPLAGTALYMTAYPRQGEQRPWEAAIKPRSWLYQSPLDILIKASNGASDFGNKFGQPLIAGSLLTFEYFDKDHALAYDKVIMLAGGIGYGKHDQAFKDAPNPGDRIVILGGDNYRIGMGGAAVSSADTGEFSSGIELNAVQRSNPEMQKRAANTIRALLESEDNPIISIHDHGAGGHLNCLSELVEASGGKIDLDKLPVGDPTLSAKELIGNESQERMGLIVAKADIEKVKGVAERERSPFYDVGEVTGNMRFTFESMQKGTKPMDLALADMFGSSPKTLMKDNTVRHQFMLPEVDDAQIDVYIENVLRLEAVACKDWLTNKVDRCVGGLVAKQQCAGPLQLPLNDCGVMALDYEGKNGVGTSMGHAPIAGLIDPAAGSRLAVTEALTNIIWAPMLNGLSSISLSANWMWPCNNPGEDARLFKAVEAISDFAIDLGINIPTGKDSLSMKQRYKDLDVLSPGTVVVSATGHCSDISRIVEPVFKNTDDPVYYINITHDTYELGGSSLAQSLNTIGNRCQDIKDVAGLRIMFNTIQNLIKKDVIISGHDISAGGMITCLLEMCFSAPGLGVEVDLSRIPCTQLTSLLFAENTGIVVQAKSAVAEAAFEREGLNYYKIGKVTDSGLARVTFNKKIKEFDIAHLRDIWYETSFLFDKAQTTPSLARARFDNYKHQPLQFHFPPTFDGSLPDPPIGIERPLAAVIREKGSNSEREMAHALYLAGFDVRDVHMTDLISGRETLEDIRFVGAVGGFSNSDVLGSAKGWAGAFLYNEKAKKSLEKFFARTDVLSIGICNGCQLFMELDLINPEHEHKGKMDYNDSGKHESAFTSVKILDNNSPMLSSLGGSTLGVWVSNGEGKFVLPQSESDYNIIAKYGYNEYPSDPNGSDFNTAILASSDGRHLVTMPHIERSIFQWNWAHYPKDRRDEVSPWLQVFVNARKWLSKHKND